MSKKELTGYPHIDRPWMQYYDKKSLYPIEYTTNLTQYLKQKNKGRENFTASSYYGREISYRDFFDKVDKAAKVLAQVGVSKGDNILFLLPNIPEAGELWLGATELGAISDFIDPRPDSMDAMVNAKKALEIIKYEKPQYIISLDKCYQGMLRSVENDLADRGIKAVIIVSASDSLDLSGKIDYLKDVINCNILKNQKISGTMIKKLTNNEAVLQKLGEMKNDDSALNHDNTCTLKVFKYTELIKSCEDVSYSSVEDPNILNYIGHTSGTSGSQPKPIPITNRNCISTLEQLIQSHVSFTPGESALHILPFFAPFGAFDNYALNLTSGVNNIEVPEFDISEFGYLIKKYHPNIVVATPSIMLAIPNCSYLEREDLSCITKVIYGGDSMTGRDEENLNQWLKIHGSKAEVEKGHGMSEFCGCGSYAQKNYNKYESIGIPMTSTIYSIVDPDVEDKLVPLKFTEEEDCLVGELVVSSDAVTGGVLHGDTIVPHYSMDGLDFIRTKDEVEMDRNGIFKVIGRKDRAFARFDGYKVKPHEIEKQIEKNSEVKYVTIVEYYDERYGGNMPICHLVLNRETDYTETKKIVEGIVYNQIIGNPVMSVRQIPSKFKVRNSMPIAKSGKIDFQALKKESLDGTEINVNVEETNLSVGRITIY